MKCILSLEVLKISAKKYSELYYEAEKIPEPTIEGVPDDVPFPPLEYGLDEKGEIVKADESEYHHKLIENPGDEIFYLFEPRNYDGGLSWEIQEAGFDWVFYGQDFRPVLAAKSFDLMDSVMDRWYYDYHPFQQQLHVVVYAHFWVDEYTREGESDIYVLGYLDDNFNFVELK